MLRPAVLLLAFGLVGLVAPVFAELAGYPVPLGGDCFSAVLVADFNADGKPEIAVAVDSVAGKGEPGKGAVYVIDSSGRPLPGWPVYFPQALGTAQMAVGTLLPGGETPQLALGTSEGVPLEWWSAWNEPNDPVFISPQRDSCVAGAPPASPAVYAELVRAMAAELDADAPILCAWGGEAVMQRAAARVLLRELAANRAGKGAQAAR